MPTFVWEAKSRTGDVKTGEMSADSRDAVLSRLRAQNMVGATVKQKGALSIKLPDLGALLGGGVNIKDTVIFTRQFATMIDAGLPLVQCLDILGTQAPNKRFGKILLDIKHSVEGGAQLSDAMAKYPKIFDNLFVALVSAGEAGGILDTILNRLSIYLEKADKLKRQIKGAMTYPIAVLLIAIAITIGLLWKVIPTFEQMFASFGGGQLPAPTRVVIAISEGFLTYSPFIMSGLIGTIIGIIAMLRWEPSRRVFDKVLLKTPLFGSMVRKVAVARFTRTLGTLTASGVAILDGLDICARAAGNFTIEDAILYTREKISEGRSIAEPLTETKVFPAMVIQMISVGESTGAMDTMLTKIADFYEDEVDVAVAGLTKLIEPAMFVFLGGMVGGLLIAMYLPIFELAGAIKGE